MKTALLYTFAVFLFESFVAQQADNPLIIQSDLSILLDVHTQRSEEARAAIAPFAELIKSPEHLHTFRLTPLSIWNARATGLCAEDMVCVLRDYARYPVPESVAEQIPILAERYGRAILQRHEQGLILSVSDLPLAELLVREKEVCRWLGSRIDPLQFYVEPAHRGVLKQALIAAGYPAEDLAGYVEGDPFPIVLRSFCRSGPPFLVRDYQREAADTFYAAGSARGGSGVIALPCGAGKTIVGLAVMSLIGQTTLVLTTSLTSVKQWHREILDKTEVPESAISEYTGECKEVGPITLSTYQVLTWRPNADAAFPHLALFQARSWGLIIYDEVHLLPAPVFRITSELQARRRMGLTATLIREDGREGDVFALIGPKRYDVPWRELEKEGFIASAVCYELRLPMPSDWRMRYAVAERRERFRIAAENPDKIKLAQKIIQRYPQRRTLILGEYIGQLKTMAEEMKIELITGTTPAHRREELYEQFRTGAIQQLILSRVGNFALDLPDADLLIQVSGKFGSRQEEAQRLGRILRPKADGRQAHFYTLVSIDSCEEDFAHHRQLFLTEQGYSYQSEIVPETRR